MYRFILLAITSLQLGNTVLATETGMPPATHNVFYHAQKGDSFEVERWLREGGDPSYVYNDKYKSYTPLHAALAWAQSSWDDVKGDSVYQDPVDVVRVLLKYDADMDYLASRTLRYTPKDEILFSPLFRAVYNDQVESARLLVKAGAKLSYPQDKFSVTSRVSTRTMRTIDMTQALSYVKSAEMAWMFEQEGKYTLMDLAHFFVEYPKEGNKADYYNLAKVFIERVQRHEKNIAALSEPEQRAVLKLAAMIPELKANLIRGPQQQGCEMAQSVIAGYEEYNLAGVIGMGASPECYMYFKKLGLTLPSDLAESKANDLHFAVYYNNYALAKWLSERSPEFLAQKDKLGRTPVYLVKDHAMLDMLVEKGAVVPKQQTTP
ncbi:hypothetical protein [Pseudoalteromonas sp. T1lg22]|uniref:hypothetical protein n=1 Tax=Pseudoalteromonas sp. T1lg22 TaxID=2077096 RepID=UPI001319E5D1|nr:hypothetical protein [Pseudoalteromonas sp. T1lg22]